MLQIALLGGLTLAWDDQPLPAISSTRARALFAYLALNRHQPHNQTVLTSLFWPDQPEPQARRRRQALRHITRRADNLPPGPYLLREGDHNLYYNPYREEDVICAYFLGSEDDACFTHAQINDSTWFAQTGQGEYSAYGDPLFVNASTKDFHQSADRPAVDQDMSV